MKQFIKGVLIGFVFGIVLGMSAGMSGILTGIAFKLLARSFTSYSVVTKIVYLIETLAVSIATIWYTKNVVLKILPEKLLREFDLIVNSNGAE